MLECYTCSRSNDGWRWWKNKLRKAVQSSLALASEIGFKSISMPAISSGIFGFPKDKCAKILVNESIAFLKNRNTTSIETVEFCLIDNETLHCFKIEFDNLKEYSDGWNIH